MTEIEIPPEKLAHDQRISDASQDIIARWKASSLYNKTPEEIYTLMQGRMDSWVTLADARTDLSEWLPLMAALISWLK